MEPSCLNPNNWKGSVGMVLGGDLYKANFVDDNNFDKSCTDLYNEIIRVIDENGIQVTSVSSGTTSTTSGSSCRGGGGSGGGSRISRSNNKNSRTSSNTSSPSPRSSTTNTASTNQYARKQKWNCSACTMENDAYVYSCNMCNTSRHEATYPTTTSTHNRVMVVDQADDRTDRNGYGGGGGQGQGRNSSSTRHVGGGGSGGGSRNSQRSARGQTVSTDV